MDDEKYTEPGPDAGKPIDATGDDVGGFGLDGSAESPVPPAEPLEGAASPLGNGPTYDEAVSAFAANSTDSVSEDEPDFDGVEDNGEISLDEFTIDKAEVLEWQARDRRCSALQHASRNNQGRGVPASVLCRQAEDLMNWLDGECSAQDLDIE